MSQRLEDVALVARVAVVVAVTMVAGCRAQMNTGDAAATTPAPKTAWGEPDLQGIWRDDYQTPLQRPPQFADKEFFSDEERAALDDQRAGTLARDSRDERGNERDVVTGYNRSAFISLKHTGRRTSLIVDPPNGRMPELTPEARQRADQDRAFRVALLQSTDTCKRQEATCAGGTYGPRPSPRRNEPPPRYNTARINRHDGPEDATLLDRCLPGNLPEFGNVVSLFVRVVQTPGGVSIVYDRNGQAWQRNIVMNGAPNLPSNIRQWSGNSRGHWEGNTLVVEVTNFSAKTDFFGSRENLHLVERWTRLDANTLEYVVTIEDPTVWKRPWTVKVEMNKQNDEANRIYYEPRCHEGNYGLAAILRGARSEEQSFAEGRGPDPANTDKISEFVDDGGTDPLRDFVPSTRSLDDAERNRTSPKTN